MKQYESAILYHNYYSLSGIDDIRERITKLDGRSILLLVSVPEKPFLEGSLQNTEDEKFLIATNQGKDIGGKLLLLDLILKLYTNIPYLILLHDKRSYQKYSGNFEREKLFEILKPENYHRAIQKFESQNAIGILGQQDCIRNEFVALRNTFKTTNSQLLKQLQQDYNIITTDYRFVAGTMFWARSSIFLDFFKKFSPIQIRATLEKGNILDAENGTVTHSWERLLCWVATAAGYKLASI